MGKKQQSDGESSSSKRQKVFSDEADENPFENDLPPEEESVGEPAEEQPPLPEDDESVGNSDDLDDSMKKAVLECPIHCGVFKYPVVNCNHCENYPMCEACLGDFIKAKNGGTEEVPCPACKQKKGFSLSVYLNGILGQKEVKCPKSGCKEKVQQSYLSTHLDKYCPYVVATCPNARFGCGWKGLKKDVPEHQATCSQEKKAAKEAKANKKKQDLINEVVALEKRVDAAKRSLAYAMTQATAKLEATLKELYSLQKCTMVGGLQTNLKVRKPDLIRVPLINDKPTHMNVEVCINPYGYYSLKVFLDGTTQQYPIWVTGFIISSELTGVGACKIYTVCFEQTKEKYEIYSELQALGLSEDATEEEQLLAKDSRQQYIRFGIMGSALWPREALKY